MPEYKPLTEAEKQAILARHHYIVDELNKALNGALSYDDDAVIAKMNDPKEVALYRMFEEHKAREAQRRLIIQNLKNKYGESTVNDNPMARTFKYHLKLDGSEKSNAYNEKLYQEYISNPDKIVYREFNKLLKINPQEMINMGDDPQKMGEFYMENSSMCENAFVISAVLTNSEAHTTPAMRTAVNSLKKPLETLNEYGNAVKHSGLDGMACPKLTREQAALAMTAPIFMNQGEPDLNEVVFGQLLPMDTPAHYFQKYKDYGLETNDPEFFTKYKTVLTDPETGRRTEVSPEEIFDMDNPNVRFERRSKDEIFELKSVNRVFQDKYAQKFQSRIATKLNQATFSADRLADDRVGGWWERNIFRNTSPEWKDFIQAFKDFNNPEHPNYLKKDILRPKAEAYRQHQRRQGYNSLEDMKGTSLKRGTLAQATIDVCDELDAQEEGLREDINIEIDTGLKNGKVGLIISSQEVDIMGDDLAPAQKAPDASKNLNVQKEKDNNLIKDDEPKLEMN